MMMKIGDIAVGSFLVMFGRVKTREASIAEVLWLLVLANDSGTPCRDLQLLLKRVTVISVTVASVLKRIRFCCICDCGSCE